jgi:hypothetical protein
MSLAEIKEALRTLTADELADVAHLAAELRRGAASATETVRVVQPSDPDVQATMDAVFKKHHDLFRRLAQ